MTNAELVLELNDCVIHPREDTNVSKMVRALDEYLSLVPGKINSMPTFQNLAGRDQLVVVKVANAVLYFGYKPKPLTFEEKDLFHPERHKWLDRVQHKREDYLIYLEFLEAAIERFGDQKI